jgi:hypothetical protein
MHRDDSLRVVRAGGGMSVVKESMRNGVTKEGYEAMSSNSKLTMGLLKSQQAAGGLPRVATR